MVQRRTRIVLGAGLVAVASIAAFVSSREDPPPASEREPEPPASEAPARGATRARDDAAAPILAASEAEEPSPAKDAATRALVRAAWGSGRGELGHDVPQEGNPEGPMSFAVTGDGLVVVDQVNGRLARYDRDGRLTGTSEIAPTTQDVAVAGDGTVALLDRLGEKKVTLTDARGRTVGELPLEGAVPDTGLVTGVFTDGDQVYVEKEHGALVPIGTTAGGPPSSTEELSGRPSKDGALLVSAGMTNAQTGRVVVNAFDRREGSLRFAREILFPRPAGTIVLLDTDLAGTIYLGVTWGGHDVASLACLDSIDGHVLGRLNVPVSATAEESFRDFSVGSDGTIAWALRTDQGVEMRAARCPSP